MIKGKSLFNLYFLLFTFYFLLFSISYGKENNIIWRGDCEKRIVALTFDDGPKPEFSQKVLDILDHYGVKASFFVVGYEAFEYPDEIMRMDDEGHEIGNHTYSHIKLLGLSKRQVLDEITRTNKVIFDILGKEPKYFRFPGGAYNNYLSKLVKGTGLYIVNWSFNAFDYIEEKEGFEIDENYEELAVDLVRRIVSGVKPGSIVLLHNGSEQTVRALPMIIEELRRKGFAFATLSQLLQPQTL